MQTAGLRQNCSIGEKNRQLGGGPCSQVSVEWDIDWLGISERSVEPSNIQPE